MTFRGFRRVQRKEDKIRKVFCCLWIPVMDGCDIHAIYPAGVQVVALAVATDGSVYIGALDDAAPGEGLLLHVDATGSSVRSRTKLRGISGAIVIDVAGNLYATGLLPPQSRGSDTVTQAFAVKMSADLQRAAYDVTFGNGLLMMGTALVISGDGSLYVAGEGTPPGSRPLRQRFLEDYLLPFYDGTEAVLARIRADGAVAFQSFVDSSGRGIDFGYRRPVAIGIGPDRRVWIAITGSGGFPDGLPERDRVPLNGVLLRSFSEDGQPAGGSTMIPGRRSHRCRRSPSDKTNVLPRSASTSTCR